MLTVLFRRDYRQFHGGHLKVWDYFQHVAHSGGFIPQIYFEPTSVWDESNPWTHLRDRTLEHWAPEDADVLFLAGMDWQALPPTSRRRFSRPVINLIQGVRHADPSEPLFQFLANQAVRIAVSPEVRDAVLATDQANGPILTIPNGLDRQSLPSPAPARDIDVLIVGVKNPAMAEALADHLRPGAVRCLTTMLPRVEFLAALARSAIAVFLPHATEGFYLPALEGMALGALVVCPDCIGNRSFCIDGLTCFRPRYEVGAIIEAVRAAQALDASQRAALLAHAAAATRDHDLDHERAMFLDVLEHILDLWERHPGEHTWTNETF